MNPSDVKTIELGSASFTTVSSIEKETIIEIKETVTHAGRQWKILTLAQDTGHTMRNKIQTMLDSIYIRCTEILDPEAGRVLSRKCIKLGSCGILTITTGSLIIYGSVCIHEGEKDNPTNLCTSDNRADSAIMNGSGMVLGGLTLLLLGAKCAT